MSGATRDGMTKHQKVHLHCSAKLPSGIMPQPAIIATARVTFNGLDVYPQQGESIGSCLACIPSGSAAWVSRASVAADVCAATVLDDDKAAVEVGPNANYDSSRRGADDERFKDLESCDIIQTDNQEDDHGQGTSR